MTTRVQMDKEHRGYWSGDGQMFFTGGVGYGLTSELQTIPIGNEADIMEAIKIGKLSDYLKPIQRQVLQEILKYNKEILADATRYEVKRPAAVRSRPARTIKRRAANLRQAKKGKRLPICKA